MPIRKAIGRPPKMSMKIVDKLYDSISHNYNVSDSCAMAKISRDTFYRYLKTEPIFRERIATARENQNKVIFSFRTLY
jgi:hypothetical protein